MKCPACGIWNRKNYTYCFRCGAPLEPDPQEAQAPATPGMSEVPASSAVSAEQGDSQRAIPFDFEDEDAQPRSSKKKRGGLRGLFRSRKREQEEDFDLFEPQDEAQDDLVSDAEALWQEEDLPAPSDREVVSPSTEKDVLVEEDEDFDSAPIVLQGSASPQDEPDEGLRFHPLEQAQKPQPIKDLSEYEDNIHLYDYTNWDDDGELEADEEPVEAAAEEPATKAVPAPTAEPAPKAQPETPGKAPETDETDAGQPIQANGRTEPVTKTDAPAGNPAGPAGDTQHFPPITPCQERRSGVEVLVPAQTLSKTARTQFADSEISREIIQAINTLPPNAEPAPSIPDPRPRRLMSLSRVAPALRAAAAKAEPPKQTPPKPEPHVLPLDQVPAGESRPTELGGEPYALKDEIHPTHKPAARPAAREEEPATVYKPRRESAAAQAPSRPAAQAPQQEQDQVQAFVPHRSRVQEATNLGRTAAEQPAPPAQEAPQPAEEPVERVAQPEWATNALKQLNLYDTPLERRSRESKNGNTKEVLEVAYEPPRRPFGVEDTPPPSPSAYRSSRQETSGAASGQRRPVRSRESGQDVRSSAYGVERERPRSVSREGRYGEQPLSREEPRRPLRQESRTPERPYPRSSQAREYGQGLGAEDAAYRRPRAEQDAPIRRQSASRPPIRDGVRENTSQRQGRPQRDEQRVPARPTSTDSAMRLHSSRTRPPENPPIEKVNLPARNTRRVRNPLRLGIAALVALVVLGLLIWGVVAGVKAIVNAFGDGQADEQISAESTMNDENAPVVAVAEVNGNPGHTITFKGNDGDIVYIGEPINDNVTIVGGIGVLEIEDSKLIGDQITNEDVSITLTPTLRDGKSGQETPLDPIELVITPPEATLELITPASGTEEVNISTYQLKFRVEIGSTVTVNGQDVSDLISDQADNAGVVIVNVDVEPIGDNVIPITVRTPGCKETTKNVILHRAEREIAIELSADTPTESDTKQVTIKGVVADGASIEVTSDIDGDVTLEDDGSFSFTAVLSSFGDNTITIVASKDGVEDIPFTHVITYNPTADDYTRLCREMDYNNLTNNVGRVYECYGEIVEILSDGSGEEPFTFIYNVGTTSTPQHIYMEMIKKDSYPTTGKRYKICADVVGTTDDGLPSMVARYWYNAD